MSTLRRSATGAVIVALHVATVDDAVEAPAPEAPPADEPAAAGDDAPA